jgi:hypothetical protein
MAALLGLGMEVVDVVRVARLLVGLAAHVDAGILERPDLGRIVRQ